MLGTILTSVIGMVAKGTAAKARAGGVAGAVLMGFDPVIQAFEKGFATGALPQVEELGLIIGQALVGWLLGYVTVWFAPKNADPKA